MSPTKKKEIEEARRKGNFFRAVDGTDTLWWSLDAPALEAYFGQSDLATKCPAVVEGHLERSGRDFLVGEGFGVGDVPFGVELNRWSLCVHRAQPSALPPRCCPALLPCLALRAFCSCAQHQADGG